MAVAHTRREDREGSVEGLVTSTRRETDEGDSRLRSQGERGRDVGVETLQRNLQSCKPRYEDGSSMWELVLET